MSSPTQSESDRIVNAVKPLLDEMDARFENRMNAIIGNMSDTLTGILSGVRSTDGTASSVRNQHDHSENIGERKDDSPDLKRQAQQDQAGTPFDEDDVYETLIDPFVRTKDELIQFASSAAEFYSSDACTDITEAFQADFLY